MDRVEAREIADSALDDLCRLTRETLIERMSADEGAVAVAGRSGIEYQVETTILWDGQPGEIVRILVSVDDGGLRSAFKPVTVGALVDVDGTVSR